MNTCPKCGVEVVEHSGFCHKCGAPLGGEAQAASGVERFNDAVAAKRGAADAPEQDIWQGTYSPKAMVGPLLGTAFVSLAAIVVGVIVGGPLGWSIVAGLIVVSWIALGLCILYRRMSVHYRLTNHRFFHEHGLLSRTTDRIELIDVDDITVTQGLFERMFGVGTLKITSSDRTSPVLAIPGIDGVRDVAGQLDALRRADRMRRGLSIESI